MRTLRPSLRLACTTVCAALLVAGCAGNHTSSAGSASSTGPIVIGTSISLSGNTVLTSIKDGYQLAVDKANAAGGVTVGGTKRKIKLVVLDNRSDTNTMVQQVRSLVLSSHAIALLGSCCQQNIDMQGQADALKTPLMMGALPVELLPEGNGYTWDSFQSLADGADKFYELADTTSTNKKILVVTSNDAEGKSTGQLWAGLGRKSGYTIASTKAVPTGTTDFSDVIQSGKSTGAQVLIASMAPQDCFAMWKQMKALAYKPKLAIGLQCAQTPGWSSLGTLGDGTLVQLNWTDSAGLPETQMIVDKFAKKYPALNDLGSVALGYHEAQVLMNAISRAGDTTAASVNKALAATDMSSALGPVKFTANKSTTPSFIGQWENGRIQQVWPAEGAVPLKSLAGLR
ncbi:ABC transporter substrate-binding protein [Streptomyces sp. NBC_00989]|uniref:ABC transporter substrate-binding protein n=1 Tax=Streptomyces sp. NBC_00989 TaxID=2903705 RepID=UPI003870DAF7|nr:ABC transporter substrate-binding protein [Streptomyces sp. NBC_00989]